jgi:hypothetical protein
MQFMKNIIWQPRTEGWITDVAGMFELYEALQEPDPRNILGYSHINRKRICNFTAQNIDSSQLWNEFMRVTKHFKQNIFRYYEIYTTHFYPALNVD